MPRHALRVFLRRFVLLGALPLGGCWIFPGGGGNCGTDQPVALVTTLGDAGTSDAGCAEACEKNGRYYGDVSNCKISDVDGGDGTSDGGSGDGGAEAKKLVTCTVHQYCIGGRRPEGLARASDITDGDDVGRYFAALAHLEAASVDAFDRLALELGDLGAPRRLVAEALRAAGDEVRHARVVGALAARFGATVPAVVVAPVGVRSAFEIALENAVAGCVEETWAAVVASWQGTHAADPRVRAALARIAVDETRHAELAWDVAAWLDSRLSDDERAKVRDARQAAVRALTAQLDADVDAELARFAGLPRPAEARALAAAATATLWS